MNIPQPPDGLSEAQKKAWSTLFKAAKENYSFSGFGEAAVEVIVRDPELCKQFLETHRRQTIQKMADSLSRANSLLDVPAEIIKKVLTIPENEFRQMRNAAMALDKSGVDADLDLVQEALDIAIAAQIMDEPDPNYGIGPTGPQGPIGVTGIAGPTGPQGPSIGLTNIAGANGPAGPPGTNCKP